MKQLLIENKKSIVNFLKSYAKHAMNLIHRTQFEAMTKALAASVATSLAGKCLSW